MTQTIGAPYFEQLYAGAADPWDYEKSAYEQAKYATTCAALEGRAFARGFEVGCSFGVLSRLLAKQCRSLLSLDLIPAVLQRARIENAGIAHLTFARMAVPAQWPEGRFDLIVLSEMLYYLSEPDLLTTAALAKGSLAPGGLVVLVNWLGDTSAPHTGDGAAEAFIQAATPALHLRRQQRTPHYRLDVLCGSAPATP